MLRDRSPLSWHPKAPTPLDLHFLGTPQAFVLSQDQTLRTKPQAQAPEENPRAPALPFQKVHTLNPTSKVRPHHLETYLSRPARFSRNPQHPRCGTPRCPRRNTYTTTPLRRRVKSLGRSTLDFCAGEAPPLGLEGGRVRSDHERTGYRRTGMVTGAGVARPAWVSSRI